MVFWFALKLQEVRRLLKPAAARAVLVFQSKNKMLPKNKRVTKDIFQTVLKKGNIVSGSFFLFRYTSFERPAYSFVVSKKIAKTATKRNSLRRIGYNILRNYELKPIAGVFFYKKEALNVKNIEIKQDIELILKKTKLI